MVTPRDGYAFSHVWSVKEKSFPWTIYHEATQKKHKNCSPNEEIPSAHVCMWSFMAYSGYNGFDADTQVPQLRFLSQFALLQYICMSDNPMENPSNNNGP